MRLIASITTLFVASATASELYVRGGYNEEYPVVPVAPVAPVNYGSFNYVPVPVHPGYNGWIPGGPGSGIPGFPGSGGPGSGGPGSGGPGSGGPGSGGPGSGGPGSGGPGSGGPGSGGPGSGGPGSGGPGSGGPGSGGPGSGGPGSGGPGSGGPGSGGPGSGLTSCGTSPGEIAALTPLLERLGLDTTVDGVKQLVDKLLGSVAGLLVSPGIKGPDGVLGLVSNLVNGLLGSPLDLDNTADALASILVNQVPCLLDTVLPKP